MDWELKCLGTHTFGPAAWSTGQSFLWEATKDIDGLKDTHLLNVGKHFPTL